MVRVGSCGPHLVRGPARLDQELSRKRCGRFLARCQYVLARTTHREAVAGNSCTLTCQLILECQLDIAGIQRRCLNEAQSILAGELFRLLRWHRSQMPQIALVAHKHDYDVRVRMISQLLQPSRHILVGLVLGDIVDEQSTNSATVVSRSDGSVTFLASGVPDLCLYCLAIHLNTAGREFNADGGLAVKVELVAREPREKIRFADA